MVPMGTIKLEVATGERLLIVEFVVVNAISPYNIIMGKRMESLNERYSFNATSGDVICI